jgi:hypothetical protein
MRRRFCCLWLLGNSLGGVYFGFLQNGANWQLAKALHSHADIYGHPLGTCLFFLDSPQIPLAVNGLKLSSGLPDNFNSSGNLVAVSGSSAQYCHVARDSALTLLRAIPRHWSPSLMRLNVVNLFIRNQTIPKYECFHSLSFSSKLSRLTTLYLFVVK